MQAVLGSYLKRDRNALELVRLLLASMVVWGHSAGVKGDFFYAATGHHMAAVAVKCFFF